MHFQRLKKLVTCGLRRKSNTEGSCNEISLWKWLLTEDELYSGVVIVFRSRKNLGSPRYRPLFGETLRIRVVVIRGLPIAKSDVLLLKSIRMIEKMMKKKLARYAWYHNFNSTNSITTNQFMHIDDPEYSEREMQRILFMQAYLRTNSKKLKLVFTNEFSKTWYESRIPNLESLTLSQGYTNVSISQNRPTDVFICAYSSPYIDFIGDKHEHHSTWGAKLLIGKIIPDLLEKDPSIEIHLMGKLGKNAQKMISNFPNVKVHGLVDVRKNAQLLQGAHIGLYPRTFDHRRSVQKIFEYIGAGLPIITFKLVDTEIVDREHLGISVENVEDFVSSIISLKANTEEYQFYEQNVLRVKDKFSWVSLAEKLDSWHEP